MWQILSIRFEGAKLLKKRSMRGKGAMVRWKKMGRETNCLRTLPVASYHEPRIERATNLSL